MTSFLRGVFSAAATPLKADLTPDSAALAEHCRRLLAEGCHGVALLGSTGEANSFSVRERMGLLAGVVEAGVPAGALLPGTGLCALPETIELTRHALELGVGAVVMLPPFYYKGVSDAGLLDAYCRVIDTIGDTRLRIILYHIPPISQVPLSQGLISALVDRYPSTIVGVKDSSGQLDNMVELAKRFPSLSIFAGADPLLLPLLREGGGGCITATSNLAAAQLRQVFERFREPAAAEAIAKAQARIVALREASNTFAQIPTIKAMLAHRYKSAGWGRVRPPLVALDEAQIAALTSMLSRIEQDFPA